MDYQAPPSAYYAHPPKGLKIVSGPDVVRKICRHEVYGCAILNGSSLGGKPIRCLVVVRSDVSPAMQRYITTHEIAHCNGWRHPGDH